MKIESGNNSVFSSSIENTSKFKIKATGKMFRILSDGIYSDKIRAILRELGCNAYDGHKAAEKGVDKKIPHTNYVVTYVENSETITKTLFSEEAMNEYLTFCKSNGYNPTYDVSVVYDHIVVAPKPNTASRQFNITLPSQLDANFTIRDFGTGLCDNDVKEIYTTYFESTKSDSNDDIGGFGLGSKSPFSYTDTFTIISYFNGEKRTYIAIINSDGEPDLLSPEDAVFETDEENGLEVSFAVNRTDIDLFWSKAAQVFQYFPVKPNITNTTRTLSYATPTPILSGNGWKLFESQYSNATASALMGPVAYPINVNDLMLDKKPDFLELLNYNFLIDFKIGDLDLPPSREQLSYDSATSKRIVNRMQQVYNDILKDIETQLTNCKTRWSATVLFNSILHGSYTLRNVYGSIAFAPMWRGQNVNKAIGFNLQQDHLFKDVTSSVDGKPFTAKVPKIVLTKYNSSSDRRDSTITHFSVEPNAHMQFAINDLEKKTHLYSRLKTWRKEIQKSTPSGKTLYLIDADNAAILKEFFYGIGNPEFIKMSSFDAQKPIPKVKDKVLHFRKPGYIGHHYESCWNDGIVDLNTTDTVYYIRTVGFTPKITKNNVLQSIKHTDFQCLMTYFIKKNPTAEIYGINATTYKAIGKKANWVNLVDVVEKQLSVIANISPNFKSTLDKTLYNRMNTYTSYVDSHYKPYHFVPEIKNLCNSILAVSKSINHSDISEELYKLFSKKDDATTFKEIDDIESQIDKIDEMFPLFFEFGRNKDQTKVTNYLKHYQELYEYREQTNNKTIILQQTANSI